MATASVGTKLYWYNGGWNETKVGGDTASSGGAGTTGLYNGPKRTIIPVTVTPSTNYKITSVSLKIGLVGGSTNQKATLYARAYNTLENAQSNRDTGWPTSGQLGNQGKVSSTTDITSSGVMLTVTMSGFSITSKTTLYIALHTEPDKDGSTGWQIWTRDTGNCDLPTASAAESANSHTISYNKNCEKGQEIKLFPSTATVTHGSTYSIPSDVPWKYDAAMYWYGNSSGGYIAYPGGTLSNVTSNTTLYCCWETKTTLVENGSVTPDFYFPNQRRVYKFTPSVTRKYKINAPANTTGATNPDIYLYQDSNTSLSESVNAARTNESITYTLNARTDYYIHIKVDTTGFSKGCTTNLNLHAIYNIKYDANGGSGAPSAQEQEYGSYITITTDEPTRTGYSFLGWSADENATTASYVAGDDYQPNADTTLYAVWKSNDLVLESNNKYIATISTAGTSVYYSFTPSRTATYGIHSVLESGDSQVYLYNSSNESITNDDDAGPERNFRLTYKLTAGETYRFEIKFYGSSSTGEIPFYFGEIYDVDIVNVMDGINDTTLGEGEYIFGETCTVEVFPENGYDFDCFLIDSNIIDENPYSFTMPDKDVTINAYASILTYSITYDKNTNASVSNMPTTGTKYHGQTYTLPSNIPKRTGYEFKGWSLTTLPEGTIFEPGGYYTEDGDRTLYAIWEQEAIVNTYTITFDGNDNTGGYLPASLSKTGTSSSVTMGRFGSAVPTRTGYIFRGWSSTTTYNQKRITCSNSSSHGGGTDYNGISPTVALANWTFQKYLDNTDGSTSTGTTLILYAQWEASQYTVTFNPNGGNLDEVLTSKLVTYDSTYGVLPTPTKTGYSFNGWYTALSGGNKTTSSTIMTTANDHTLYARWQANKYTVTYDGNGATGGSMSNSTFYYDTSYNLPDNKFQKQYTVDFYSDGTKYDSATQVYDFVYWTNLDTGISYSNKESIKNLTSQNNDTITLTAIWASDGTITLPNGPTKDDESFMGWKNNSTNEILQPGVSYQATKNTTFTAEWQNKESVMITYQANGTGGIQQESKYIGDEYEIEDVPSIFSKNLTVYFRVTKDGTTSLKSSESISREFSHWNTQSNGNGVTYYPGKEITITEELKLYAIWKYAVIESDIVPEMDIIPGYRFDGWYSSRTYSNSNKITFPYTHNSEATIINIYGQYVSENDNTITYYLNDGTDTSFYSQAKTYNEPINIYNGIPTRQNEEKNIGYLNFAKRDGQWVDGTTTTKKIDLYSITEFTFKNWNTEQNGSGTIYYAGYTYDNNSDLTLYAQWTPVTKSAKKEINLPEISKPSKTSNYTITLDSDGSKTTLEASYIIQYPFNGWINDSETVTIPANQTTYIHTANSTIDTFYPLFTENKGIAQCVLPTEETYNKPGYKLLGWSITKNGNINFEPGATYVTGSDQTLYTRWEPLGLVHIRVDNEWKYAIPYIYDGTGWRQAIAHVYEKKTPDSSEYEWKVSI